MCGRRPAPARWRLDAAARRTVRTASVRKLREPDKPQHFVDALVDLVHRLARLLEEPIADVLTHRQRVEQRPFLEHHPDIGANRHQLDLRHLVDALPVDGDGAPIRFEQPKKGHGARDPRIECEWMPGACDLPAGGIVVLRAAPPFAGGKENIFGRNRFHIPLKAAFATQPGKPIITVGVLRAKGDD